ncbi:MAG: TetR family transcriptional regulator [Hyphomonas sp.]|nr:TetR family transcriptional regulator [Hyphomonas sp.]
MSASKRDDLVQNALKAFYAGGFHAIGMDRLAKETGVSKTAIYKHFRTKNDLILATLRLRDEQFRNWLIRRAEALEQDPKARLLAVFVALGEWFAQPDFRSCMFIKASSEYQDRDDPIHNISAEHKRLVRDYFGQLAKQAGFKDADLLARQLLMVKEGAIVLAHLHGADSTTKDAIGTAKALIDVAE